MKTRTVTFEVSRTESWYPQFKVPAHLDEDEALEWCEDNHCETMHDGYRHKQSYYSETSSCVYDFPDILDPEEPVDPEVKAT